MVELNPEAFLAKLAGVAGACVSMNFIQGTWPTKIGLAVAGAVLSYYLTPYAVLRTGLPDGLAGFLLGLFGMAIAEKVWRLIEGISVTDVKDLIWERITGKTPKKEEQ